jgi:hypothetical protein
MALYHVINPAKIDGRVRKPGETVEADPVKVEGLVYSGAVKAAPETKPKDAAPKTEGKKAAKGKQADK